MSPKIVIRLSGGLGNQLFQFFAGLKVAEAKKMLTSKIFIDTRFLSNYETKRNFDISFITNLYPGIKTGQPDSLFLSAASRFRLGRIFDCKVGKFELVHSVEHLKRIKFSSELGVTLLDGYFQDKDILFSEMRRCLIAENLFNEDIRFKAREDLDCWLRCHEIIGKSVKITTPMLGYRIIPGQISGNKWLMIRRHLYVLRQFKFRSGRKLGLTAYLFLGTHCIFGFYNRKILKSM
jgi:hypothetical protein